MTSYKGVRVLDDFNDVDFLVASKTRDVRKCGTVLLAASAARCCWRQARRSIVGSSIGDALEGGAAATN
jgi:hypothetical protein